MKDNLKNYKKQLVALNVSKMQRLSIIIAIISIIVGIIAILIFHGYLLFNNVIISIITFLLGSFVLTAIHELLHALGFLMAGSLPKDIKFGVIPAQLMVYCTTKEPMTIASYKFALIIPLIVVGIIPWIISIWLNNIFLVLLFSTMISGASGDIIMFRSLMKKDNQQLILDHPSSPAYYLIFEDGKLPKDFVEVTEEAEMNLKAQLKPPKSQPKNKKLNKMLLIILLVASVIVGACIGFYI